jgi:hemerythrin
VAVKEKAKGGPMAFFTWNEDFSVSVEQMDAQHKEFFAYLNRLFEALHAGEEEKAFKEITLDLEDYIQSHFANEESMLSSISYPGLESQQNEHSYFVNQIRSLRTNFHTQSKTAVYILQFMRDWFVNHILSEDMNYAAYLQRVEVKH